jgi:hypothetical protein
MLFFAWKALMQSRPLQTAEPRILPPQWVWRGSSVLLAMVIGLRFEVGGDWQAYNDYLDRATGLSFLQAVPNDDLGYDILNWIGANVGGGIYFVNTACALLFCAGLFALCGRQPYRWLALVVAVPYLVTVVSMGYTRQAVAIGVSMLGLVALLRGQRWRYIGWIVLAVLFHKSAIVMLPFALVYDQKRRLSIALGIAGLVVLVPANYLWTVFEIQYSNYVIAEYDSKGALVRLLTGALPAIVFLSCRKKFGLDPGPRQIWTVFSIASIVLLGALMVIPSSTAVDRIGLYMIPLQIVVWSRVPQAFSGNWRRDLYLTLAIVLFSCMQLFVWLVFSNNAFAWVPYQLFPWVWLWS